MLLKHTKMSFNGHLNYSTIIVEKATILSNIKFGTERVPFMLKLNGIDVALKVTTEMLIHFNRREDCMRIYTDIQHNEKFIDIQPEDCKYPKLITDEQAMKVVKGHYSLNQHLQICATTIMKQEEVDEMELLKREAFKHFNMNQLQNLIQTGKTENLTFNKQWKNTLYFPKHLERYGLQPSQFWDCIWQMWAARNPHQLR